MVETAAGGDGEGGLGKDDGSWAFYMPIFPSGHWNGKQVNLDGDVVETVNRSLGR